MIRKTMKRCKSALRLESGLLMTIILVCIATAEAGRSHSFTDNKCSPDSSSSNNACTYLDSTSCTQIVNGNTPTYYCAGYSVPGLCTSYTGMNCKLTLNKPCGTQMNCSNNSPVMLSDGSTPDCVGAPDTCTSQ